MKEDDSGGLSLPVRPVRPVRSLVIVYWGGMTGRWGGAWDVGRGWGSSDWISFMILFRFRIAVESRVEVVFSLRSYLTIIF